MTEKHSVAWVGAGRMGSAMAGRLLDAGEDLTVWNRTRSKAADLAQRGAVIADDLRDLAAADIVFVMVARPEHLEDVLTGDEGLLTADRAPGVVVDCSTVDAETSARMRAAATSRGTDFLASPVSGNPHVVAAGDAVLMASGPRATYDVVQPYLDRIAKASVYVGDAEQARLVKICHNLYLGMLVEALSEVTVLAERSGVPREAFLEFLDHTVLATEWVRRRTPDLLALDWTPTFTTDLLRKDFDIGLAAARGADVPMPMAAGVRELIQTAIGRGHREDDFLSLFEVAAESAGFPVEQR